ncbi:MAG: pyridoxamine 5'-phosphate oxidase family protein [Gammaproteobacteria bacterium]|nr:pyridoxamine 5'-phosphate oxidase family protein [Gammaproteobacteria bacterium]MCP5198878.1 pyridoxamine 5'-phosphate oxidase family protein [Gammaproteobacteria bacterium]
MSAQPTQVFESEEALRDYIGRPLDLAVAKAIDHLDKYCRAFIERSPFLCISTASADGRGDVSPRGDGPGFVQVLDPHTLFIPDRPGNNRLDTMTNIIANPNVGLLFLVPGFEDCLRVNGRAQVVRDDGLLAAAAVKGRTPLIGIRVAVDEAYLHCAKAIKRSKLWDEASRHDRGALPSIGKMILEQTAAPGAAPDAAVVAEVDELIEDNYRNALY